MDELDDGTCLSSEQVTSYIDGVISPEDRDRIERHLVGCEACADEIVAISRELRAGTSTSSRRRRSIAVTAAIAVTIAGILLLGPGIREEPADTARVFRASPGEVRGGVEPIRPLRPIQAADVDADSLVFAWRSAGDRAVYTLTVTDEAGGLVWSGSTEDTILSILSGDSEIALKHAQTYFWYVDALLESGASASTGVQLFRVMD